MRQDMWHRANCFCYKYDSRKYLTHGPLLAVGFVIGIVLAIAVVINANSRTCAAAAIQREYSPECHGYPKPRPYQGHPKSQERKDQRTTVPPSGEKL